MNTELLTFIYVYESHSFSIAARELFVTQPTVSLRISQLEKELGTDLFVRTNRHDITPTNAGKLLYKQAIQLRQLWQNTRDEIRYVDNRDQHLIRIGLSQTLAETIMTSFVTQIQNQFNNFDWNITVDNSDTVSKLMAQKKLDIGIIEKPILTDTNTITRKEIAPDQLVRIGKNTGTWLIREQGSGIEHYTRLYLREADIMPQHTIVLNRNDLIRELVDQGLGETIVSKSILPKNYPYQELGPHFVRALYLLHLNNFDKNILNVISPLLLKLVAQTYRDVK
ncbi:LysR family transcriptional regulator [Lapidilactobacillus dextrinicus DSM 20335]|uniref:LysR family transcriptional regulator n=1 Tax=Lapidilactobacillus dextrinicus DSM 20335 TaxID=1423738 RepID=A0A0R2BGG0_9LACO|nr:LysR family transcriptional regulator [Lapidilactobacillus dextrinicus]KRM78353.1 LysR family transcriptional regulator [Lapidilactobacillus dextrinicus DSM 20335]QFG47345.1 LysR family transcriptional regulator [Lapidilactobacillus dextrinicus]